MTLGPRVFGPVPVTADAGGWAGLERADITVDGLDHSGSSYEVRIFLNNPTADARTPMAGGEGYAGSIHVYGYGQPPRPPASAGDDAPTPIRPTRSIIATEAVRAAAPAGSDLSVTLVPIAAGGVQADVDLDGSELAVRIDVGAGGG